MASWSSIRGCHGPAKIPKGAPRAAQEVFLPTKTFSLGFFKTHGKSRKPQKWIRNVWVYKQWQAGGAPGDPGGRQGPPKIPKGAPRAAQGIFLPTKTVFLGAFRTHGKSRKSPRWVRNVWVYRQWQAGVVFEDAMAPPRAAQGILLPTKTFSSVF